LAHLTEKRKRPGRVTLTCARAKVRAQARRQVVNKIDFFRQDLPGGKRLLICLYQPSALGFGEMMGLLPFNSVLNGSVMESGELGGEYSVGL